MFNIFVNVLFFKFGDWDIHKILMSQRFAVIKYVIRIKENVHVVQYSSYQNKKFDLINSVKYLFALCIAHTMLY